MRQRVWQDGKSEWGVKKRYLVRLDRRDLVVGVDKVAGLFDPLLERAFGDGLGHLRDLDGL